MEYIKSESSNGLYIEYGYDEEVQDDNISPAYNEEYDDTRPQVSYRIQEAVNLLLSANRLMQEKADKFYPEEINRMEKAISAAHSINDALYIPF